MVGRAVFLLMLSLLIALPSGCDEKPPALPATMPSTGNEPRLELKPLTPLLPNRPTHIAVDLIGNIYWTQETDRTDDTLFVIGEGEIPRATQLSVPNIAAAMGAPGGRGNLHGIAAGPRGEIYFFFNGALGRRPLACLGVFTPADARIRILADTDAIAEATNMGRSLTLARASMTADNRYIWLWIRHSDAWAMFRLEAERIPKDGPIKITRAFEVAQLDGKPIELTREEAELSPAQGGEVFVLDPNSANLLQIGPSGIARVAKSLIGLPNILSTPSFDAQGNLVLFAAAGPLVGVKMDDPESVKLEATFPAFLTFTEKKMLSIDRDHVVAYPGFQIFAMKLRQLVPHVKQGGWISFDAGSGELLRLKIAESTWQ